MLGDNLGIAALLLDDIASYELSTLRRDTEHKFLFLKTAFTRLEGVTVKETDCITVLPIQFACETRAQEVEALLLSHGIAIGTCPGALRLVANFPLYSKEMVYKMIDALASA